MRPEVGMALARLDKAWRNGRAYYLRRASRLVGEHDAQDALSNAVVTTLLKGDDIEHASGFLGYAVGFESLHLRRKRSRRYLFEVPAIEDALDYEEGILDRLDPEKITIASEILKIASKAMDSLDDVEREALVLASCGVSYLKIGRRLGFSTGKAHGIVRKARARILGALGFDEITEVFQ